VGHLTAVENDLPQRGRQSLFKTVPTSFPGSRADQLRNAGAYLAELNTPALRLGVTGLARAGKTVFIAALVRNLIQGGRLPFFRPFAEGRIVRAYLEPQPDDAIPRFDIETHLAALAGDPPQWPESTSRISQLRVTIEFQPTGNLRKFVGRILGQHKLHVDIVDYPGEWLLDLGLLDKSYVAWSAEALASARKPQRGVAAAPWLAHLATLDPDGAADEAVARAAAAQFTAYLHGARTGAAVATLGPGRFLLPGDLAGSPLVTFVPLEPATADEPRHSSLAAMMQRRFESYKREVVRPFFSRHFGRLDRQIVLVDALAAIDAGAAAVEDLTVALTDAFNAFRPGSNTWGSRILNPRIDRIMFAATKADHLPRASHDRLEAALSLVTQRAMQRARFAGADVKVLALAALRSTREAEVRQGTELLPCIAGVPLPGEQVDGRIFDGRQEAVIFPGDLPADPAAALLQGRGGDVRIARFRPPRIVDFAQRVETPEWPHIRLDRALDFLIGDRLT
jgi:uncharacterized protein